MFRALSHQLFGSEEHHYFVRLLVARFENFNQQLFATHLHPTESSIATHVYKMAEPFKWGTDLEIIATATYFQKPIYYVTNSPSGTFHWEVTLPLKESCLRYPEVVDYPSIPEAFTHLELQYINGQHYNSIVSTDTGHRALDIPTIPQYDVYIETLL